MAHRITQTSFPVKIVGFFLILTLTGCNYPGLSPTSPTQETEQISTEAPTEILPTEVPSTASPTIETLPDLTSTESPSVELPGYCRPFPDQIYPLNENEWIDGSFWAKCGGSSEPILVHSPVEGLFFDYNNQTGRLLYGTEYVPSPDDLDTWVGNYTLWVYDFRTNLSTKWIQGGVLEARWSTEGESQKQPRLAVIIADGTVGLVPEPDQVLELANIMRYDTEMDACCIAWAPEGDRLAYIKNEILYAIKTTPQEPRLLAENAYGRPIWVQDQQLLLFPSSIVKVAQADGSGPFIPQIPDGNRVWVLPEHNLLWDPENKTLVFDEFHIAAMPQAITWTYIFSEDFKNVTEQYSCERQDASYLLSWFDHGETVITSNGEIVHVGPNANQITIEGVIDRIYQGRYLLWLEDDPYPRFSLSLRAQMKDTNGDKITVLDLKKGMSIRVTGQSIGDGCGFLATEIQIIEE